MCYPSPGPRCASHTKTAMIAAGERLAAASEALNRDDSPANLEAKKKANEDYFRAQVEYCSTPRGQQMITGMINKARESGGDETAYVSLQERGRRMRATQMRGAIINDLQALSSTTDSMDSRVKGTRLSLSAHAVKMAVEKGFDAREVATAFKKPERVYDSGSHPGQVRVTGNGMCLVGERRGNTFNIVTIYLDGVVTPPRADQAQTAEGRDFASRYQRHGSNAR